MMVQSWTILSQFDSVSLFIILSVTTNSIRIIVQSLSQCGTSAWRKHMYVCLSTYTLTLLFFLSLFDAAPQSSEHQDASCSLCTEHDALDFCAD